MTESEKRREELLRRARTIYSDKKIPPAVHPRYQSFYTKLYDTQEEHEMTGSHSTFGVRMLFALFVAMDYKGAQYAAVDSKKIIQEIERQIDID